MRSCYRGHLEVAKLFYAFSLTENAKAEAMKLASIADNVEIVKLILEKSKGSEMRLIQSVPRRKWGPKVSNFLTNQYKIDRISIPDSNTIVIISVILALIVAFYLK